VLSRSKQEFMARATQVFKQSQNVQEKEARIAELERTVGKLTMQIELQKSIELRRHPVMEQRMMAKALVEEAGCFLYRRLARHWVGSQFVLLSQLPRHLNRHNISKASHHTQELTFQL
jgi:hypothetical protein